MEENWILMKFDFFDILKFLLSCAPDLKIRLSSRANVRKILMWTKVLTKSHVSGFVMAGASLELVPALVVQKWRFHQTSRCSPRIDNSLPVKA